MKSKTALVFALGLVLPASRVLASDDGVGYGTGFFPEPFLVDEGDLEREARLTWFHQEGHGLITDQLTGEVEWSFGRTTVEVEAPWESDKASAFDPTSGQVDRDQEEGFDSVQLGVRHPIWQCFSADQKIENTLVGGFELAIPSNSPVGKDTELVPQLFDLLRIGDHFSFQTHVGYSTLLGSDPRDKQTLEYSADFGYLISRADGPLAKGLDGIVPMIELAGERGLNNGDLSDDLQGILGVQFEFESIGTTQPRIGVGFVLPIDKQARDNSSWGIVTSLVFDL